MLPPSPSQQEVEKAKRHGEACLMKCADSHVPLIPKMIAKYRATLDTCS